MKYKQGSLSINKKFTLIISIMIFVLIIIFMIIDFNNEIHIQFSKESGFYDKEIELKILGGGENRIYYTLDGGIPTTNDYLYDGKEPIRLTDATYNENVYSARTDISTFFYKEWVDKYPYGGIGYTIPDYYVDKCNVVRASVFDKDGNILGSISGVYFIGFSQKEGYGDIYIASIMTAPDNLFGYDYGIYVTGKGYDDKKEMVAEGLEEDLWWRCGSNYTGSGIEWEREADIKIFNKERERIFSENCGIRIQGGGSRRLLPKSIGCYARETYGGSDEFHTDIFQENQYPHKFVFFSGGDDNVFKLKDYIVNSMEQELSFSTMAFIPCALFLNGEYWGVYYITENYNSDYISDHFNVEKNNVIMIKSGELHEGSGEDFEFYNQMIEFITNNDMSVGENYEKACEIIDIDSYIDYYAAQIYIARSGDWPRGNIAAWRTRKKEGSDYGDCKWRWMLYDVNSRSLSVDLIYDDTLSYALENDEVFCALYENDEFRVKFAEKILYIGSEIFSQEKCESFLDAYTEQMKSPMEVSNLRFYNSKMSNGFDGNVEDIRTFFENRYDAVWDLLVNNIGKVWLEKNGIQK
ncbi:MAG: CotH kinase family protein [Lachnospiraceae bacterium]|nr:CotH kinase family protein [Lachnospiraceae bacterium]